MKKLIAILMVLAIVAGFAFADSITSQSETHTVVVKADVAEVLPAFALKVEDSKTNTNAVAFTDDASYPATPGSIEEELESFSLDVASSFTATAHVVNNVKTNHGFTLTFSDGVFGVKRNTVPNLYYSPSLISVANGSTDDCIKQYGNPVASASNDESTSNTILRSSTTVTFSGTKYSAQTPNLLVATATYSYPGDATIDPTATDEYYYANVVLTVEAL